MTAHRRLGFGSGDESARAEAAPALNALRSELLVLPRDEVIERHVDMMAFEQQLLATPRFAKTRAALPRPRRAAVVFLAVFATLASCGLSAAGALPAPLQHLTDSIARTLGVPQPHDPSPAPHHAAVSAPHPTPSGPAAVRPASTPTAPHRRTAKSASAKVKTKVTAKPTERPSKPVPDVKVAADPGGGVAKPGPTKPSHRRLPSPPGPPPSNDSKNTPAGYPDNWRTLAGAAATTQLQSCAQADTLSPKNCPQVASAPGGNTRVTVRWTLVNTPEPAPVVVARVSPGKTGPATTTYVYERFQMGASYTEAGRTYVAYSGGIAAATMRWDGSAFTDVSFSSGSAADRLLPGVTVPTFRRPGGASDTALLAVLQAGFSLPAGAPAGRWTVTGDPTHGAVVTFDAQQGDYTVTGTYTKTSSNGNSAKGQYTATLFFDGQNFQIVSIVGS
ncbi:MAG TPA: hypothetical protein VK771_07630 [Acidimicrobiia bacterium]|nr:hypothetical protein [Acidimicrobiia bacterium]